MHRSHRRGVAITVVALLIALTGCGSSADVVIGALPPRPTSAPTTSAPPETTTPPDTTSAPETTTAPDTTVAPDTTTPSPGGGGGSLPAVVEQQFMSQCKVSQTEETCACIWNAIEGKLDVQALLEAGSTGSIPPELQQQIMDATMGCMTTTS